jgi:alpha 1,3-glucosidase
MRPMLAQYPNDSSMFHLDQQYMLSDKLLVAPVLHQGATNVTVHIPVDDIWYDFDDYKLITVEGSSQEIVFPVDEKKIPVFQRGGTIIPKQEMHRNASIHMKDDPISLFVALDTHGHAEGTLFADVEPTFAYLQGFFAYYRFQFHDSKFNIEFLDNSGSTFMAMNPLGNISIAGLNMNEPRAVAKHENGEQRSLPVEVKEYQIVIDASELFLSDIAWTIEVNGSFKNFICGGLLLAMLSIHLIRMINF